MISNQAFFNKVKKHLLKQMRRCHDGYGHCLYLKPNGDRCGIGGALPKKVLKRLVDADANTAGVGEIACKAFVKKYLPEDIDLADDLQGVHDTCPSSRWETALDGVARRYDLKN